MAESSPLDKALEAEIEAALGDMSLGDLMNGAASSSAAPVRWEELKPGDKFSAPVFQVGREELYIEMGPKAQGVCSLEQFEEPPKVGEVVDFRLGRFDAAEGVYFLTRAGAVQKADWEHLEVGQVVEAHVTGKNKGGLELEVAGHRAFMPAGQVDLYHVEKLEDYVGQSMACEVVEFNRKARNIVLSRRVVLEREREAQREELWATLAVGQEVEGVVRKLMPFGAFVDLGGVDGLVHISDLSYKRINDPSEVVHEGQKITVKVLTVDQDANRIGLGLKQCDADPFTTVSGAIEPGGTVTGRVTKTADFGAFVELEPGVEGLIHISELSHERVNRVDQVIKKDEIVTVKVLDVEPSTRRISLSLKAMKEEQDELAERSEDKAMARLRAKFGDGRELKGGLG